MLSTMKVAKIIDSNTIVINAGSNDGITLNTVFQIVGKNGDKVKDPDTGQILGTLSEIKGRVIATHVYPNMTVAETEKRRKYADKITGLTQAQIDALIGPMIQDDLNVKKDQITGGMPPSGSPVKIGDTVQIYKWSRDKN